MKANLSQRYGEHTLKTQQLDTKTTHLTANIDYRQYINLHQNLFTTTGTPVYTESTKYDRKGRSLVYVRKKRNGYQSSQVKSWSRCANRQSFEFFFGSSFTYIRFACVCVCATNTLQEKVDVFY